MSQASIVKVENGQVKVFNEYGSGISNFSVGSGSNEKAVSAIIRGDEVYVTRANGKVVVCTISGSQKRII